MKHFANLPPAERELIINESAGRLGLVPLIVEKDFWVCWTLGRIFEVEAVASHVVFKGGTSLSKVFGAIQRFSEDIDLAVSPRALGFTTAELDQAPSASQRRKRVQALEAECARCVSERFHPALEAAIAAKLDLLEDVVRNIPGFADDLARVITATEDGIRIVGGYFPNGQAPGTVRAAGT